MTFLLLERIGSLMLSSVWSTGWFLGTRCSSLPVVIAFTAEKLPVVTTKLIVRIVGLAVATVELLSTKVLRPLCCDG